MIHAYSIRPLGAKPETYPGFSERLVVSHFENNYAGAVKRLNAIAARLDTLDPAAAAFEWNGLKREEVVAYNSMVLHEVYFEALGAPAAPPPDLAAAIDRDFGSFANWRRHFAACAKALAGGSGWVVLVRENRGGRLAIQWSADHTMGLAGATPVLALDMYEHAYHMDYGAGAGAYVDAYFGAIDWTRPAARWRNAGPAKDPHAVTLDDLAGIDGVFVDARRGPTYAASTEILPGALRIDPAAPDGAKAGLPRDRDLVVYCVLGFGFSRDTAAALRSQGYRARYLDTGIVGWRAMGNPLGSKAGEGT